MQVQDDYGLGFLDLKLKFKNCKIADVLAKPTNSYTYVRLCSCYPRKYLNNMPHGILLRQVKYVILMKSLISGQINLKTILLQGTKKVP